MARCLAIDTRSLIARERLRLAVFLAFVLTMVSMGMLAPSAAMGQETTTDIGSGETSTQRATSSETATARPTGLDLKSLEQQTKKALAKVLPAVVAVSGGSGVVVSEDGYVLTVAHVGMRAGRRIRVTFPDGRRFWGRTLGNDAGVDAGLLKLDGNGPFPYAKMGDSEELEIGQWCLALGYPVSFERGKAPAVRIGRVLANRGTSVVTDCTIMGGDSGGPLFDLDGNVIGVSSRCDNRLTINIHVPVHRYEQQWDRLVKGDDFNSFDVFLGVGPDEAAENARIGEVFDGSGAAKAGLKVGDVILKFDGQELARYRDLPPLILKRKPGDEVEIEIQRGDELLKLKARLGSRGD